MHHQSLTTWSTPTFTRTRDAAQDGAASPDVSPTAGADSPRVSALIMRAATASGKKVEYIKPRSAWVQTGVSFPGGARDSQDDRGGPVWGTKSGSRRQG